MRRGKRVSASERVRKCVRTRMFAYTDNNVYIHRQTYVCIHSQTYVCIHRQRVGVSVQDGTG